MEIGLYTPEIKRISAQETFAAIHEYGAGCVQLNLNEFLGAEMPETVDEAAIIRLKAAADANHVRIAAVNATFNMASVKEAERLEGVKRLENICRICQIFDCRIATLLTGSRAEFGWIWSEENLGPEAWGDLVAVTKQCAEIAARYKIYLAFEIEARNVVDTAEKAKRLIEEVGSPWLKLILDGANLFKTGDVSQEEAISTVKKTIELMKDHIVLAHGKDIAKKPGINFACCGEGIVPFTTMLPLLKSIGYDGPVIIHGIKDENKMRSSIAYMQSVIDQYGLA